MAVRGTFGAILRDAREHKGLSIAEASRRLRVRPDILISIEEGDFRAMPPQGYARNMISSYSRFLGLNSAEITSIFIDESRRYHAGTLGEAREPSRSTLNRDGGSTSRYDQSDRATRRRRSADDGTGGLRHERNNAAERSQSGSGSSRRGRRGGPSYSAGNMMDDVRGGQASRLRNPRRSSDNSSRYNDYSSDFLTNPKAQPTGNQRVAGSGKLLSKVPVILVALVLLGVLFFVGSSVVSCMDRKQVVNVSDVPITGLTDTTNRNNANNAAGNENANSNEAVVVEKAPEFTTLGWRVDSGDSAYIELYEGDNSSPSILEILEGPKQDSVKVTDKAKLVTTAPDNIVVTVDDNVVSLNDDGAGIYSYELNFNDVLADWMASHSTKANNNSVNNNVRSQNGSVSQSN